MAVAIELSLRGTSLAADPRFPDWPCNQIKVPEISVAAVWAGPSIDDVGNAWEEDATIKDLVARLAARRTPLDDAQKAIADAITGTESERQKKAKLIFAGLFKTLTVRSRRTRSTCKDRSSGASISTATGHQRPAVAARAEGNVNALAAPFEVGDSLPRILPAATHSFGRTFISPRYQDTTIQSEG
jgi:hypothetical protein